MNDVDDQPPTRPETIAATAPDPADRLFPVVYDELKAIAEALFRRGDVVLQPTAVVHEAYVKLAHKDVACRSRDHFVALAARAMRQVLVDEARRRKAGKRGGDWHRISVDLASPTDGDRLMPTVEELDHALGRLEVESERKVRVVELRYFAGLGVAETAVVLGVSERTVKSDWRYARAWLRAELTPDA